MNFSINKKLILIKIHFFLFNAGIAPLIIFGPTIAKQTGCKPSTVGLMYTILPLTGLFVKTMSSAVADRYNKKKLVFMLAIFACLFSALSMTVMRTPLAKKNMSLLCHSKSFVSICHSDVSKFHKTTITNKSHADVNCELTCEVDIVFARELCNNWNHCSTLEDLKNKDPRLEHKSFISTELSNITFFVKLEKKHAFWINECFYALISEQKFDFDGTSSSSIVCNERVNSTCKIICDSIDFLSNFQNEESDLLDDLEQFRFWIVFFIFGVNWCGMALTSSMSDTICFDLLGNEPSKYGQQRLWGALGWGLVSIFAGGFVDLFSKNSFDKNYEIFFYWSSLLLFLDLIAASFIRVTKTCVSISIFKDIKLLFYSMRISVFGIWCIFTGLMSGIVWSFLFWYLEDISTVEDLQWSKTLQGLDSLFTTIFGELPFFFISGWIVTKLGHGKLMSVILLAIAIRLFGYSLIPKPVWVLPIELINGFAFSMCYVAIASYSYLIAPVGAESTIQALFSALFDGLGISFGGLLGGFFYYRFGGRLMFQFFGYISVVAWMLHIFIQMKFEKEQKKRNLVENTNSAAKYSTPNNAIMILENS